MYRGAVLRNAIAQQYALVVRTAPQKVVEIAAFRQRLEKGSKFSASKLADEYNKRIQHAEGTNSDQVTEGLVDQANTVWSRALCNNDIMTVVMGNVTTYGHGTVFNSIGKMNTLVQKGETAHHIKWLYLDFDDQFRNGGISSAGVGLRELQGSRTVISWPQMSLFRCAICKQLRDTWLEVQPVSPELKSKLRECTASHEAWRRLLGYQNEADNKDMTWKGKWPAYLDCAIELFRVVFDNTRSAEIEQHCKSTSPEEFVSEQLEGLVTLWNEGVEAVEGKESEAEGDQSNAKQSLGGGGTAPGIPSVVPEAELECQTALKELGFAIKDADDPDALQPFIQKAQRLVRTYVKLLPEETTVTKMVQKINQEAIASVHGKQAPGGHTKYFAFMYSLALSGELATAPHVRLMSFRKDDYQKAVDTYLKLREDPTVFPETDVALIFDGFKHGLKAQFLNAFQVGHNKVAAEDYTYSLIYDADQIQSRLGCVRGFKMSQVEWMHCVHNPNGLNLKIRPRTALHCTPGSPEFASVTSDRWSNH